MNQYIPDLTERFPEGFDGVDMTDKYFPPSHRDRYDEYEIMEYIDKMESKYYEEHKEEIKMMEFKDALNILCDSLDDVLDNLAHPNADDDCEDEWLIWIRIPDELNELARIVTYEDLEDYWYELTYHPDDDSVYAAVVGDGNIEQLDIDMLTANKIRDLFRNED